MAEREEQQTAISLIDYVAWMAMWERMNSDGEETRPWDRPNRASVTRWQYTNEVVRQRYIDLAKCQYQEWVRDELEYRILRQGVATESATPKA